MGFWMAVISQVGMFMKEDVCVWVDLLSLGVRWTLCVSRWWEQQRTMSHISSNYKLN
jgi:hypothetical protein